MIQDDDELKTLKPIYVETDKAEVLLPRNKVEISLPEIPMSLDISVASKAIDLMFEETFGRYLCANETLDQDNY